MAILLIGIGLSNAQVSQVTGNVMSEEDGLPVVGASVLVKGTTVGTVTDIDGNFTISGVPASAKTLVVSFYRFAEPGSGCKTGGECSVEIGCTGFGRSGGCGVWYAERTYGDSFSSFNPQRCVKGRA